MSHYWIGVDLGGTKILAALFDDQMNLIARAKQPSGVASGPVGVFTRIGQAVETVLSEGKVEHSQVRGLGFGIPGQIVPDQSVVRYAPNLEWRDLDLRPLFPENWTWPVVLENDVRMGTYGEFARGAATGAKNIFGLFAGTGVGGGLILNGELFNGFNGHAGEIGHIIVNWRRGSSLEHVAGRKSMMRRAKELLEEAPKKVRKNWKGIDLDRVKSGQLAQFYSENDPIALSIITDASKAIGAGIATVINLLSPEVVVVGGGVAGALGDSFIEHIWETAKRLSLPGACNNVRCVAASLGDDAGVVGCAAYARAKLSSLT